MEPMVSAIRYHYMDNLRALAMMLGVFYHAALAYSPFMEELWLSADKGNLQLLDYLTWFTHLFRMPLFFFIAGFFSHHLVFRRGVRGFLKNRIKRILLPFLLFLPIIIVSLIGVVFYASVVLGLHTTLLDFVVEVLRQWPSDQARFSTSHLWFLYNLIWFCSFAAVLYHYVPISLSNHRIFQSPVLVLGVLPILLVPAMVGRMTPYSAPESIVPELWAYGFFGGFFFLGWVFYVNRIWLAMIRKYWLILTVLCISAYLLIYYPAIPDDMRLVDVLYLVKNPKPLSLNGVMLALASSVVSLYATFLCLLVGYRYLDRLNPKLRYIADSSYWVYLIHLPVLIFIQVHLIGLNWPLVLKFVVGSFGTIALGMVSYALFVRGKPIGLMLNGR